MRGKPHCFRCRPYSPRIIPAHAGQTRQTLHIECGLEDHPRACGANSRSKNLNPRRLGSSPRMRGKRCVGRVQHPWPRIIPAHAGQTRRDISTSGRSPDHPRACGANGKISSKTMVRTGSSPRMRGKLRVERGRDDKIRIIPAHAGQTHGRRYMADRTPDHPRACGANKGAFAQTLSADGSSPRMRGKPEHRHPGHGHRRIIPAHAGQTSPHAIMPPRSTDHPRACGANGSMTCAFRSCSGSSPRMRGKHDLRQQPRRKLRIIPAHAGQTDLPAGRAIESADHPRACGANIVAAARRWP